MGILEAILTEPLFLTDKSYIYIWDKILEI